MSANLDLARSIFAATERSDFSDVAWAHPDIEYVFVDGANAGLCGQAARRDGTRAPGALGR